MGSQIHNPRIILTRHARDRAGRYQIEEIWIEATITHPEHTDRDPMDPALIRAWRPIPERGGRALRVVGRTAWSWW